MGFDQRKHQGGTNPCKTWACPFCFLLEFISNPNIMSLKFFFDRNGIVVKSLFVIGWLATICHLYYSSGAALAVFAGLCFFVTLIRFIPWYSRADRGFGIEEHFQKTLVPTSYIMTATNIVFFFWKNCGPFLVFASLLITVILCINFILIYFHFKDKDPTPPSLFSRTARTE